MHFGYDWLQNYLLKYLYIEWMLTNSSAGYLMIWHKDRQENWNEMDKGVWNDWCKW